VTRCSASAENSRDFPSPRLTIVGGDRERSWGGPSTSQLGVTRCDCGALSVPATRSGRLVFSLAAHCLALAGVPIPGGKLVGNLHIGIFVVWVPTVLVAYQSTRYANREGSWKVTLAGCPPWMRLGLYVLFGCAFSILSCFWRRVRLSSPFITHR
jgi:hypothetical protein